MPIGGETIGTAYVRILADGSGLDRSIRDQMDDVDWDKNTRKTTSELADSFKQNMERDVNQRKLREAIADPLAKGDWLSNTFFRSRNWSNFRSGLTKEYGEAGKRAAESLERGLLEGTIGHGSLTKQLENMGPLLARMQREINKETSAAAALAEKHGIKLKEGADQSAAAVLHEVKTLQNLKREFTDLNLKVKDYAKGLNVVEGQRDRPVLLGDLERISRGFTDAGHADLDFKNKVRDLRKEINFAHPVLARFNKGVNEFGDGVGKAFGKGSRNNFVNFIGVLAGGFAKFPLIFTKAGEAVVDWVTRIRTASGPLQALGAAIAPLGVALGGLAGAFLLLGPLISGISLLAGGIVALTSTISFGLVGAAAAAVGALAPLGVAVGATLLAFQSDRGKKVLKGFKKDLQDLGDVAGKELFPNPKGSIKGFHDFLLTLSPLVKIAARSVHQMFGEWEKGTHSRTFGLFKHDLGVFLPVAMEKFGRIISHVFGGIGGVLRALFGLDGQANRMLDWLVRVTNQFDHFVNGHKGQLETEAFFQRAGDSARRLGDFLGAASRLLGTLLTGGQKVGDSLFGSMTNAINNWNDSLKSDNGSALKKWFDDAGKFARDLGKVFVGLGRVFATLDTELSRQEIGLALDLIAGALNAISDILAPVASAVASLGPGFIKTAGAVGVAVFAFVKLKAVMVSASEAALLMQASMSTSTGRFTAFAGAARLAAGAGGLLLVADSAHRTSKSMSVLEGAAGGAMTGAALGSFIGPEGTAIGAALGGLAGGAIAFARGVKSTGTSAKQAIPNLNSYKGTLDEVSGAITKSTRATALDNLNKSHAIDRGHALGLSTRVLINASLGVPAAMNKVRAATDAATASLQGSTFHYDKNGQVVATLTAEQRKAAEGAKGLAAAIGLSAAASDKDILAQRNRMIQLGNYKKLLAGVPAKVVSKIDTLGLEKTRTNIIDLTKKYHLTPAQVKTVMAAANVKLTKDQIQSIIDKAKELGRQHPTPRVDVSTGRAISDIERVRNTLANLKDRTVNLNIVSHAISVRGQHPVTATGGVFQGAQVREIAEAGPEAVVPLQRPLSQVDPAVRWLSAIAQGKIPGMASGGLVGSTGRTVNVGGVTVLSTQADPKVVAIETVNRLVGVGY